MTADDDAAFSYEPPAGLPRLVHEDESLLVADKPCGLLSVPGRLPRHHDSALLRLQAAFGPLWVVHRLDMDTSGLMAFARSRSVAANLGLQFEHRTVGKRYEAIVWGTPPSRSGRIDLPLRLDWPHRPRQLIDGLRGKPALTAYRVLQPQANFARLELEPHTGRSHQLRVHLSAIGHPIVGDRFYGHPPVGEPARAAGLPQPAASGGMQRLMLHARSLQLRHPVSGHLLEFTAPVPF